MSQGKTTKVFLSHVNCVQEYLDNRYVSIQHLDDSLLGQLSIGTQSDGTKEVIKRCMKEIKQERVAEDPKFEIEVMLNVCTSEYPYFVKLIDAIEDDHFYCTILEYVPDGDLCNYIQSHGSLSLTHARKYANQLAQAVATLHSKGYCHLDISLENVLINHGQDCIKLCDFGLSRKFTSEKPFAPASIRPGKKNYLAPEIFNFQSFYGPKCDIFSLGVLFFIFLTGFPPFNKPHSSDKCFELIYGNNCAPLLKQWDVLDNVPKEAQDLLNCIFVPAAQRISSNELLNHPWLSGANNVSISDNNIINVSIQLNDSDNQSLENMSSFALLNLSNNDTVNSIGNDEITEKIRYDNNISHLSNNLSNELLHNNTITLSPGESISPRNVMEGKKTD